MPDIDPTPDELRAIESASHFVSDADWGGDDAPGPLPDAVRAYGKRCEQAGRDAALRAAVQSLRERVAAADEDLAVEIEDIIEEIKSTETSGGSSRSTIDGDAAERLSQALYNHRDAHPAGEQDGWQRLDAAAQALTVFGARPDVPADELAACLTLDCDTNQLAPSQPYPEDLTEAALRIAPIECSQEVDWDPPVARYMPERVEITDRSELERLEQRIAWVDRVLNDRAAEKREAPTLDLEAAARRVIPMADRSGADNPILKAWGTLIGGANCNLAELDRCIETVVDNLRFAAVDELRAIIDEAKVEERIDYSVRLAAWLRTHVADDELANLVESGG